ncbi:MAG: tripartite tricarboxylate transporter substrate binding protein [Betaproteobacteria bacterium]|nr:tripartite tricarboxylate transporter substrate binding protein [Betaproteobacteria bacterium]
MVRLTLLLAVGGILAPAGAIAADAYPVRPIRMIVAFSPGGGTDIIGRIAAQGLFAKLGQQVVVDNRPGAGGNIGTAIVARSAPDGYTLITAGTGSHAINPSLYANIPYDAVKDFTAVCLVASSAYLMVVHPAVPAKNVAEFIDLARARPGQHIPYKGTGAVFADLIAGQVQVLFGDIVATSPHAKSGRLRALGITSAKRSASLPEFATIAESGVPGYDAVGWFGVFAPAGTPRPIVMRLNAAIIEHFNQPEVKTRMSELGADIVGSTPEAFAAVQRADLERWARVVKAAAIRME